VSYRKDNISNRKRLFTLCEYWELGLTGSIFLFSILFPIRKGYLSYFLLLNTNTRDQCSDTKVLQPIQQEEQQ